MKLNDETLRFIHEHCKDDVRNLALQAPKYPGVDMPVALTQIAGRRAAAEKIPSWYAEEGILYPRHLSLEQCSTGRLNRRVRHRLCFSFSEIPSCHLCGTAGGSLRNCFA